jgi:hypothetical protein
LLILRLPSGFGSLATPAAYHRCGERANDALQHDTIQAYPRHD